MKDKRNITRIGDIILDIKIIRKRGIGQQEGWQAFLALGSGITFLFCVICSFSSIFYLGAHGTSIRQGEHVFRHSAKYGKRKTDLQKYRALEKKTGVAAATTVAVAVAVAVATDRTKEAFTKEKGRGAILT
ncbi:hypothetical protein F5H01DRAFT_203458 [Linnemannia elongata]|nr:hypothetical protein F5H01DRAFT_203458 [Linnemannia elongata]